MRTLKTYECCIENYFNDGSPLVSNHSAVSASKARYIFWQQHGECLIEYSKCFKYIKTKSCGSVRPEHFFGDLEKFKRICKSRNIEFAYQGMIIDVDGKKGWIVGGNSSMNLNVLFEGEGNISNCHPTWKTTYYDNKMNIIKDFK